MIFPHLIPVPAVRPDFGLWREIESKFVVLHPNYHQYSLLSEESVAMVRFLLGKGVVPLIVIREEDERGQHPLCKVPPVPFAEIDQLAAMFPDNPFIVLNAYGEYNAFTSPNVYVDLAFFDAFPALKMAIKDVGSSRILFGSNAPFFCINSEKSKLSYDQLTQEDIELITHKNMEKILNGK